MIDLKIEIKESFRKNITKYKAAFAKMLQEIIEKAGYLVERESKMVTPIDTGRLRASIMTEIGAYSAIIAPHTDYAFFVHEGTRFMSARPFMKQGYDKALPAIRKEMGSIFKVT